MSYNYIYTGPDGYPSTLYVSSIAPCESNKNIKNRFCYSYKAQGFIDSSCKPIVTASSDYLSSISCATINGEMQTSQQTFLLAKRRAVIQAQASTILTSTIQSTIQNASTMSNQIYSQLLQVGAQRYTPYQPYIYPVMPSSVMQLKMLTANAGVPMTPITCLTGKGNQRVTS